jgi:hypothetical protein
VDIVCWGVAGFSGVERLSQRALRLRNSLVGDICPETEREGV